MQNLTIQLGYGTDYFILKNTSFRNPPSQDFNELSFNSLDVVHLNIGTHLKDFFQINFAIDHSGFYHLLYQDYLFLRNYNLALSIFPQKIYNKPYFGFGVNLLQYEVRNITYSDAPQHYLKIDPNFAFLPSLNYGLKIQFPLNLSLVFDCKNIFFIPKKGEMYPNIKFTQPYRYSPRTHETYYSMVKHLFLITIGVEYNFNFKKNKRI